MMYLPLDKWINTSQDKLQSAPLPQVLPEAKVETDSTLVSGRETVRPTEPLGRNE